MTFTEVGSDTYGGSVYQFRNASGIGASSKTNVASGAPTLNITTTQANSAIVVANDDWSALSGTRTWRTNAGPFTEKSYALVSGQYTIYGGFHANAGAIGTYAVGLSAPTGQKYSIAAVEVEGVSGPSDTTPPSTPSNLTASAVSSSQVNLSWTASTDNVGVTGYKIFRGGTQVGTSATNSYSDTGLTASTVYSYTVSAYDAAGNNSAQSSATGAITQRAGAASIAVGGRVVTTANLNVRSSASASATKLGTEPIGSLGTVVGGPTSANGYTWWQINYDNGVSGWSIGTYLLAAAAGSSPAVGMAQPANNSLTLIHHLMQQVQALSARIQSLQSQVAGAGAAVGN